MYQEKPVSLLIDFPLLVYNVNYFSLLVCNVNDILVILLFAELWTDFIHCSEVSLVLELNCSKKYLAAKMYQEKPVSIRKTTPVRFPSSVKFNGGHSKNDVTRVEGKEGDQN